MLQVDEVIWPPVDFRELCLSHLSNQEQVFDHMWMKLAGRYQGRDHPAQISPDCYHQICILINKMFYHVTIM